MKKISLKKMSLPRINLRALNFKVFMSLPESERRITIPTLFTIARIIATPLIVTAMIKGYWNYAFFFFLFAAITDVIDGTLARVWNEKTFLGACLDPIADKFLLLSCFFTLAFVETPLFRIPHWFVLCVLSKEIIQLAGASIIYCVRGCLDVRPTQLGKLTTFVQIVFIMWLFACYFFQWFPIKTYYSMLGVLLLFVGASFGQYFRIGLSALTVGYLR
jgi:cardiolipin synthase